MSQPQTLEEFVTWVLNQDPELAGVNPAVRRQLETDYVDEVTNKIDRAIFAAIPEDRLPEVEKLLDDGGDMEAWTLAHIPNAGDITAGVMVAWKKDYLGE